MLRRNLLRATIASALAAALFVPATGAMADGGMGGVTCDQTPTAPECQVTAGTPGSPGGAGSGGDGNGGSGDGSGGGSDSPCTYMKLPQQQAPPPGAGPGAWYEQSCLQDGIGSQQVVWLADGQVADPEALARVAVSRLRLPAPAIRRNPSAAAGVLAQVPVWWWVDPSTWGQRSATASVPGMSVTATATPVRVVWRPGDGTGDVVCQGPGTPWRPGSDPRAASSCGHTYRVSSAGAPGNAFTLTATVTWSVSWAGGGRSAVVPPLTTTGSVRLPVAESQATVTGRR
ncbi:hypothetical protein [Micromonospora inositola]|uniref:ATP/GTP-binding protein n=1 Tax=Micromonospora inositola TaxID=47865 RepID=A0A1C5K511_9ACTN|nr:hypothetical protein [Micromonospora inositola]SCG77863.1 hypothetical protein GA0070613_6392 [Micromonospora inositola]